MPKKIRFEDWYYNDWLHFRARFETHSKLLWAILAMLGAITAALIVNGLIG